MEILNSIAFWIISVLLVLSAIFTLLLPKISHSILAAFSTFFLTGMVFFSLNSPFNAALQIAVYSVAIIVLLVFGIMLTNEREEKNGHLIFSFPFFCAVSGIILIFYSLIIFFRHDLFYEIIIPLQTMINSTDSLNSVSVLSFQLFTKYIFVFELVSVLLLAGIVGICVLITNKERKTKND